MKMQIGEFGIEQHKEGWVSLTYNGLTLSFKEIDVEHQLNNLFEKAELDFVRTLNQSEDFWGAI